MIVALLLLLILIYQTSGALPAAEIRDELMPLLLQACEVFDRAKRDGLHVSLNLTLDQYGLRHVPNISVLKVL